MSKSVKWRIGLSVFLLALLFITMPMFQTTSSIGSAVIAGSQLNGGAMTTAAAAGGVNILGHSGAFAIAAVLFALCWIWGPLLNRWRAAGTAMLLSFALVTQPAQAFYAKQNKAEPLGIPTNSTAFWIPDQGDTASTQVQTEDANFFNSHKVPGKIFIVPHAIFQNSGGTAVWDQDYYTSTGVLILVDRTPVTREWTSKTDTGTSAVNQGFECQTNDGLNVSAAVDIAVSIKPEDAATYLYYFGTDPIQPNPNDDYMQGNPNADPDNDPNVIFASEKHARSLSTVMDTVGHGLVEAAVCQAIGSRNLNEANRDYVKIMTEVETSASAYLSQRGITVDYIGWAGTFGFDPDVQTALNNAFAAQTVQPYLTTLTTLWTGQALEGWDHHLPSTLTLVGLPEGIGGILNGLLNTGATPKH